MMEHKTTAGPILIGIAGTELDATGREHLCHPAVGGVVLFSRNYACRAQLLELVTQIRACCQPAPLVCIDQEGGRVQRLREDFTALPPLGVLGAMYATNPDRALDYCYRHARVMAAEMLACGIDLSFAPVLDLDRGSLVIGDRSFSDSLEVVCDLGRTYLAGMHDAGMKATGKHFPGHGSVLADSHSDDVIDDRSLAELERTDLVPFTRLASQLDALMIAHVVYPQVDQRPAGYSRKWLGDYLRGSLGYKGVIMSDDLGMHAAHVAGNLVERCLQSLQAGCDLVLACQPADVEELLGSLDRSLPDASRAIASLYGMVREDFAELETAATQGAGEWRQWQQSLESLGRAQVESGKYTGVSYMTEQAIPDPRSLITHSSLVASKEQVDAAVERLAREINDYYGDQPIILLAVMTGAIMPAARLAGELRMPLRMDFVHATRYAGQTEGGELYFRVPPRLDMHETDVLIVDDIFDVGLTLELIEHYCLAGGARSVNSAVLVRKIHDRQTAGRVPRFIGLDVPDKYVFGCGMDAYEHWRHLNEIRALETTR